MISYADDITVIMIEVKNGILLEGMVNKSTNYEMKKYFKANGTRIHERVVRILLQNKGSRCFRIKVRQLRLL